MRLLWYHQAYLSKNTDTYLRLANASLVWLCKSCYTPKHTSILYKLIISDDNQRSSMYDINCSMGPIKQKLDIPTRLCTTKSSTICSNNFQYREPGVVTSMLSNLKWESFEGRSTRARTVLMYKIIHNLAEIYAELDGCSLQNDICTGRYLSLFILSYHQHLKQHTTSSTSGQYNRPVPCRDRVHYPSRAVPHVNSVPPYF